MPAGNCIDGGAWTTQPADAPGTFYVSDASGRVLIEYRPREDNGEITLRQPFEGLSATGNYLIEVLVETGGSSGHFDFSVAGAIVVGANSRSRHSGQHYGGASAKLKPRSK